MGIAIRLKEVSFKYDGAKENVLENINLTVEYGETVLLSGVSGEGKSTLLSIINGVIPFVNSGEFSGSVEIGGKDVTKLKISERSKLIGTVLQNADEQIIYDLVNEEIAFGCENLNIASEEIDRRIERFTALMQIEKNAKTKTLSGGQKQRVGIARALACNPKVLLCDEATSALDPQTTKSILELLLDINKKMHLTIVMITHQMEVVRTVCDRVAVIEHGDIIEEGSMIDVFTNPQHPTTKEFTKSVINAETPDMIKQKNLSATYVPGSKLLVRVSFLGDSAGEPIISSLVKRFSVDISILYGNIDQLKDMPFGTLIIEVCGDKEAIDHALDYLHKQNLKTEVIGYES